VKSINYIGFSKKIVHVNSGIMLHCLLEITMLLLQTCGMTTKIGGSYQEKLLFFPLQNTNICGRG
jgi:hypothetical protein